MVYCNCDDPYTSQFYRYFKDNFTALGLKKVITSCYENVFKQGESPKAICAVWDGQREVITELTGDGDFRSEECIALLKEADIVVSNPPFSLFRDYVKTLLDYKKDFLIIGPMTAAVYREINPAIKANKIWFGVNRIHRFTVPAGAQGNSTYDPKTAEVVFGNIRWFTTLDHSKRHKKMALVKRYDENRDYYQPYDNYPAINVPKTRDIPADYRGVMGVPVTFLDTYCPEQFEIVKFRYGEKNRDLTIKGKELFTRILIRRVD